MNNQIQEAQKVANIMNAKRPILKQNIIKFSKVKYKGEILKTAREKQLVTYRETPITL